MSEEKPDKSIQENIFNAIESGKLKMRPKWVFLVRAALLILGIVLAALALLYLVSFSIFILRQNGVWFVPVFGLPGIMRFLLSLPWLFIGIAIIFIVFLEILVRRYSFAYGRPLLYSVLAISLLVLAGGIIVEESHFHEGLNRLAQTNQLPIAGGFYRFFGSPNSPSVVAGEIEQKTADGFDVKNFRGEIIEVTITPQTRFPLGTDFAEGDSVVVLGDRDKGKIKAIGVREVDMPERPPHVHPSWRIHF